MYRTFNNNSDTLPHQSNQNKLEILLSAIEGTTSPRMDDIYAEVAGTAIGQQHHLNRCNSSMSSSKSSHGTQKNQQIQYLTNASVDAAQSRFRTQRGPPCTIFAGSSEEPIMGEKGDVENYIAGENKNVSLDDRNASNSSVKAALLGLTTTSTSQAKENSNYSTSAVASNTPFNHMRASTSALINNEILVSNLVKQLSESYVAASNNLFHNPLSCDASAFAINNVSYSNVPLLSSLLMQQKAQQEEIYPQHEISNDRCSTISAYQDSHTIFSQHINHALEDQHIHSMQIYLQLQNQVNEVRENYIRMIEDILLQQQEAAAADRSTSTKSDEKSFRHIRTSLTNKRNRDRCSDSSKDQPEDPQSLSKRKRSSYIEPKNSGNSIIMKRKKRKNNKKRRHDKATTDLGDDSTIKTSSPRLESAFKRFYANFDKFTLSCMEEVGYAGEECSELLPTFQNEVIRESRYRKR